MIVGQLELQMMADVARIKRDIDQMNSVVSRGAKQMQSALDDVRSTMQGLFSGISVAAFGAWIKGAIDFQDQLNDLNKTTDITIGKLAGISLMSKQTGSDLTGMAQAMNKMSMEMGKAPEKFARIGVTAKEPLEAFKQFAEVFRSIEDPQLRAAVAAEALGKGWASSAPALAEGADAIDRMVKRGEELAGITRADALAADEFNDSLSELQIALMGSASAIGRSGGMVPMLTELVRSLTDVTHESNQTDMGFSVLTETMRAVIVFGGNVGFVIHGIAKEIGILAAQTAALGRGDFKQAFEIGRMAREDAEKSRAAFDAWEQRMMSAGKTAKSAAADFRESERAFAAAMRPGANTAALRNFLDPEKAKKGIDEAKKLREKEEQERMKFGRAQAIQAVKDMHDQWEAVQKLQKAEEDARREREKSYEQAAQQTAQQLVALEEEAANWKKLESQIAAVKLAKMEQALAGADPQDESRESLARQIESQRRIVDLLKGKELREANEKAAEEAAAAWRQVGDAFVDNLMRGGKSVAEYLKDLFRTLVLRPILAPIGTAIGAAVGTLPTAANAGGTGALGAIGNLTGLAGIGGAFGGGLSAGFGGLMGSLGIGGTGATLGGSLSAGSIALGSGNILGGLGTFVGALGPIALGIGAIAAALGAFKKGGGPKVDGRFGSLNSGIGSGGMDASVAQTVAGIQATYDSIAKSAGVAGGLKFGLGLSTDPKGSSASFIETAFSRGGSVAFSDLNRNAPRDEEALKAAVEAQTTRLLFEALKQSDLPAQYASMLAGGTEAEMAEQIAKVQAMLEQRAAVEERIFQLTATELGKVTRERERELEGLDEATAARVRYVHTLEDEAKRTERLTGMADRARSLARQFVPDDQVRDVIAAQIVEHLRAAGVPATIDAILGGSKDSFVAVLKELQALGHLDGMEAMLDVADDFLTVIGDTGKEAAEAADRMRELQESLMDIGQDLSMFARELKADRAGTAAPWLRQSLTAANYEADLAMARAGDLDAYRRLSGSATSAIDAQKGMTASGPATQALIDKVLADFASLPAVQSYEQQNLELLNGIVAGINALPENFAAKLSPILAQNFDKIDTSLDGFLSADELRAAGLATDAQLAQMMLVLDANGDGQISKLELLGGKTDTTNERLATLLTRIGADSLLAYKAADIGRAYADITYNTGNAAEWARLTEVQVFQQGQAVVAAINGLRLTASGGGGTITFGGSGAGVGGSSAGLGGTTAGTGGTTGGSLTGFIGTAKIVGGIGGTLESPSGSMPVATLYRLLTEALEGGVAEQKIGLLKDWSVDHALVQSVLGMFGSPAVWPAYERGTAFVPETGPAILHRGERVVTASENSLVGGLLEEVRALREELRQNTRVTAEGALRNESAQNRTADGVSRLAETRPERYKPVGVL
jgi:hypothetical protein